MDEYRFQNIDVSITDRSVVKGVSFFVPTRGATAFMGPSGCGKTTLFRAIAGLIPSSPNAVIPPVRYSFSFQEPRLLPRKTLLENILCVQPKSQKTTDAAKTLLKRFGLEAFANDYPQTLSGGMRQRASLIRAMLYPSDILLLDEPFQGLDPENRHLIEIALKEDTQKRAIFFTTHQKEEADALADTILFFDGPPLRLISEQKNTRNVQTAF